MNKIKKQITIRLSREALHEIEALKKLFGETYSHIIRQAIHDTYINMKKEKRI